MSNNVELIFMCILAAEAGLCLGCAKEAYKYKRYDWMFTMFFCVFVALLSIYKLWT